MQNLHLAMSETFRQDRGQSVRKIGPFAFNKLAFALAVFVAGAFIGTVVSAPQAIAGDINTEVTNPIVNPVQANSGDNVTVSARVNCTQQTGGNVHSGCDAHTDNGVVDEGSGTVTFEAYLPVSTTSCDSDGATLIPLGTDNSASDPWSVTFTPGVVGLTSGQVYFLRITYTGDTGGHGTNASDPLDTGCAALATLAVVDPNFSKELVSGPSDVSGADVIATPPPANSNDDGIIWIGLEEPQYFIYRINIDNDEGVPLIVSDVVGADFDLDGHVIFEGVEVTVGACTFDTSQPHPGNDTPAKEPEFIDIQVPIGEECTVEVRVVTVENPGNHEPILFEPTGTRIVGETVENTPVDIYDTYTLNEGIKVFDASDGADSGERIIGPVGSLQLTPIFPDP